VKERLESSNVSGSARMILTLSPSIPRILYICCD
ncbi:MAG: hypothetical protein ACI90V_012760, partial [Bacillariaceae sp.]|jgi:hypothetical protein